MEIYWVTLVSTVTDPLGACSSLTILHLFSPGFRNNYIQELSKNWVHTPSQKANSHLIDSKTTSFSVGFLLGFFLSNVSSKLHQWDPFVIVFSVFSFEPENVYKGRRNLQYMWKGRAPRGNFLRDCRPTVLSGENGAACPASCGCIFHTTTQSCHTVLLFRSRSSKPI